MLPRLSEIKKIRTQLDITQTDLSKMASVSQSLIAKIENGQVIPTYDKAKRIFDALYSINESNKLQAKDLMTTNIKSIKPKESVKKAVDMMKNEGISQVPVLKEGVVVGTISEKGVLKRIQESEGSVELGSLVVEEIMGDASPIILEDSPFYLVYSMLEHHDCVLVGSKGKIVGIITKMDLLSSV